MKKARYPLGKTLKRLMKNVTDTNKGLYGWFALYTIAAVATPIFPVLLPKLVITQLESGTMNALITQLSVFCAIWAVFLFGSVYLQNTTKIKITMLRLEYLLANFHKLLSLKYCYREDATFYEKHNKALEATSSNDNGIEGTYHKLFEAPAQFIFLMLLAVFVGALSPIILVGLVIHFIAVFYVGRLVQRFTVSKNEEIAHCQRRAIYCYRTSSDFAYGKDARLYRMTDNLIRNYRQQADAWTNVIRMIRNREFKLGFLSLFTLLLSDAATYFVLIYMVANGMSIGSFSMYLAAVVAFSTYINTFGESIATILNEAEYVSEFFDFQDSDIGEKGGDYIAPNPDNLEIEFKNMSFRYPNTEKYIFKNLNLKIKAGEKLAIVGINGAGKSTLVKLMCGLFDPTEGEILLNGVNILEYSKKSLYSLYSIVFQAPIIMAFPIKQNVACSATNIDEDRVRECLKKVGLWEKIQSLPKNIDQPMLKIIDDDGIELSGGQTQKLAIARALYRHGAAVIMDEPTAALDALAEAEIYQQFDSLIEGKTAIYISHRLASTKFCDNIALFDNDGLKEYGTHDELMAMNGSYCEMFTIQGKYYREGAEVNA